MASATTQNPPRISGPHLRMWLKLNTAPFEEGLQKADDANRIIASNRRLSRVLVGSKEWRRIQAAFWAWTGTMTAYTKPDQKLGKQVEYTDPDTDYRWVFPVPEEHQDKTNSILVTEHPAYTLEIDGKNRVIHTEDTDLVEAFPPDDGWYQTDAEHGIPTGEPITLFTPGACFLWRVQNRVGPAARSYYSHMWELGVDLEEPPSATLGMLVERWPPQKTTKDTIKDIFWADLNGRGEYTANRVRPVAIWVPFGDYYHRNIIIPFTTSLEDPNQFPYRYPISPNSQNGLNAVSYAMVDQITSLDAERLKEPIGTLDATDVTHVGRMLKDMLGG